MTLPTRNELSMHQDPISITPSRHNRWYERILLNPAFGHLIALAIITLGAQFLSYQSWVQNANQGITLALLVLCYAVTAYLSSNIAKFVGRRAIPYNLATVLIAVGLVFTLVLFTRIGYARTSLIIGLSLLLTIRIISVLINRRFRYLKLACVPTERIDNILPPVSKSFEYRLLDNPSMGETRYDGLIVDMEEQLEDQWIRFVSHCNIAGLPVFNARKVAETINGKVNLSTLQSIDLANLQPQPVYLAGKRALDILLTLLVAPLLIPFCLIVALLIKLDSPGPAIFVQQRIGKGNRIFRMYKFRSMRPREEDEGTAQFADQDAYRITRLGAFIRKVRIDELPQFLNILKGEMSLIGPRPEQPEFVEQFEEEVPYYSYRHIVRPGITGWAQVNQGYASDTASTREKVEHDFYYIKNLSPALDFLIVMRTLKTMATGFGAL